MKFPKHLLIAVALVVLGSVLVGCASAPGGAASTDGKADPLFINMTTDDSHRANMALSFGMKQLDLGHPLTVFLNDKGVFVGSTANADKYAEQQKTLAALMQKGAVVYSCPMCMEHYGINEADLVPGIKVSAPESIGEALFKANTRTLGW
jgi:sulfur relay (sulfurtransferase) complex TusBCD TusD component (DsrE family)